MKIAVPPRVLIISHNALSDHQSNGKTITSFFHDYDKDSVAQIYFTTDTPDFTISSDFFQLHDLDALKRVYNKSLQGRQVTKENIIETKKSKEIVKKNKIITFIRNNISPAFMIARDIMWTIAGYKTNAIVKFIDNFNPDIVFFQGSNSCFSFDFTKWVCSEKNIPMILQITDDYITPKWTLDIFFWIHLWRIKKRYQWAMHYAHNIVVIGEKMANEYQQRFGGNYLVAMNSVSEFAQEQTLLENLKNHEERRISLLYAGNLALKRWLVLEEIINCLKEIDADYSIKAELIIYSLSEIDNNQKIRLEKPPYSHFNGGISSNELVKKRQDADILVHVEAFDKKNQHITRLSVSTKISEYLASGRCIFAVGPNNVASIEYIEKYQTGVTVTSIDKAAIKSHLLTILKNPDKRFEYANRAISIAKKNHNKYVISEKLKEIIFEVNNQLR